MDTQLSTCPKLKQGQLLMQRYQFCSIMGVGKYLAQGQECKRKSIILAKRMRDHADQCPKCSQKDQNFYGVD